MEFRSRKHLFHQNLLKCFLCFYWILDASLLIVSLEAQIHIQSTQSAGTSDVGVLTDVFRFSPLPSTATVNPAAEMGAVAVLRVMSSRQSKLAGSFLFLKGNVDHESGLLDPPSRACCVVPQQMDQAMQTDAARAWVRLCSFTGIAVDLLSWF